MLRKRLEILIFSWVLLVLACPNSFAAGPGGADGGGGTGEPDEPTSIESLIRIAAENNPRVKAARLNWAGTIQKYPQARSLDDPMLTYTYPIEEMVTRNGPQDNVLKLTQKIPFPGKLGLKADVVEKEVEAARTRYEKVLRDIIVEVKKSYYELYYIDRALELAGENKLVLEQFTQVGTADYASDATALNDVVKAQSQYAQAAYDVILLQELRSTETTRLNTLLNLDPEHPIASPAPPELKKFNHTLDELYNMASENEEMKLADIEVEKNAIETELAKYRYRPDFQLGLSYTEIGELNMPGATDDGRDAVSVSFGINVPLWFSKNKAAVSEAEIRLKKNLEEKAAVKNEVLNMVKRFYFRMTNSERLVILYGESLVPQALKSMEIAETWYENGEGSLSGLLETQSIYYNFQLAYYRSVADYLKSVADLERVTGKALDR